VTVANTPLPVTVQGGIRSGSAYLWCIIPAGPGGGNCKYTGSPIEAPPGKLLRVDNVSFWVPTGAESECIAFVRTHTPETASVFLQTQTTKHYGGTTNCVGHSGGFYVTSVDDFVVEVSQRIEGSQQVAGMFVLYSIVDRAQ